jgi:hypothetical protein
MGSDSTTANTSNAATSNSPVLLERDGDVGVLTMSLAPHNLVGRELSTA